MIPLQNITVAMLDAFIESREVSPGTRRKELAALKVFFRFLHKRGMIDSNPAAEIEAPELPDNEIIPYTSNEITRILFACESLPPADCLLARAAVLLMRWTGLRISDVAALRVDQVQDGQVRVFTQKNRRPVLIPLPAEVVEALEALKAYQDEHPGDI